MSEIRNKTVAEQWPIENLRPYENNSKIHTTEQVKGIAKSIRRFGWDQPIVVDGEGIIIKGHGRWMAAKELKMLYVPVVVRTDLTAKEAHASRLADNRVAQSGIDTEKLHEELVMLADSEEIDLTDMGFTEKELTFLTEDIGSMEGSVMMEEVEDSDRAYIAKTEEDTARVLLDDVQVYKALGFRSISGEDAVVLSKMMMRAEAETGLEKAPALITWLKGILDEEESVTGEA